jgi:hypothetical protein
LSLFSVLLLSFVQDMIFALAMSGKLVGGQPEGWGFEE